PLDGAEHGRRMHVPAGRYRLIGTPLIPRLSLRGHRNQSNIERVVLVSSIVWQCWRTVGDRPVAAIEDLNSQRVYHGTKADLKRGDLIEPGYNSNYGKRKKAAYVYLTATLDAATWGAELALGEGPGRIYMVEPTGPIEDDPNLTNKKYPGNPTKSYRS